MSLSRPIAQNPAQRFMDWSGSRGELSYWDKEKSERIPVKLPFKFIVLDELHTITGYSDADQSGFWSNENRKTSDDFTVRTKRGVKYVGPYKDGRSPAPLTPQGSKYTKSVYIAQKLGDEWVLSNLKLSGAALTAWIDLTTKHRLEGKIVALVGSTEGTKGATKFQIPTFEYGGDPDDATLQIAVSLDTKLQAYLDTYLSAPKFDDTDTSDAFENIDDDETKATPEQLAEFESLKSKKLETKPEPEQDVYNRAAVTEAFGDEPINLDDIPF
jgi:hypothetical protein